MEVNKLNKIMSKAKTQAIQKIKNHFGTRLHFITDGQVKTLKT
jgi:hypothetical protein